MVQGRHEAAVQATFARLGHVITSKGPAKDVGREHCQTTVLGCLLIWKARTGLVIYFLRLFI
uniref:Uncharacterized protein n=1 Tax=Arundo donax TaxID=35708 RepID=A0A0A9DFV5_ARUDO